jgi:Fic family protein
VLKNNYKDWIWTKPAWPHFSFEAEQVMPELEKVILTVAPLNLLAVELNQEKQLTLESLILLEETLSTAKIEGEFLDRESVRSSIAKRLGVGQVKRTSRSAEAFVDILLESVRTYQEPLSDVMLKKWHHAMFFEKPILQDLLVGDYRNETMQIISGAYGKQKIHYEAPCDNQACVSHEMKQFLMWFNQNHELSGYIKAAIAKFWFVTVHPFDDGNGRLSRIIAERVLANNESNPTRLYSISYEIEKNRHAYYELLEKMQKYKDGASGNSLDLTEWIIWFLQQIHSAAKASMKHLDKIRLSTKFWDENRHTVFNPRQTKLIDRLLETDDFEPNGIARNKYKSMTHTTDITAARDLKDLVEKKILKPVGEGRSRKYILRTGNTNID